MSKKKPAPAPAPIVVNIANLADDCLTVPEACEYLKISRQFLYHLIADKKLKPRKVGKWTRIPGKELLRYLNSCATELDEPRHIPGAA